MEKTTNTLAELLSIILGEPVSARDNIAMGSHNAWDSIKHIEIIMAVEERFGVSFAAEDIPLLTSQALLADKLAELRGESAS